MLYLVTIFDKWTKEYYPVGIFDNKKTIDKIFKGYKIEVVDYKLNVPDYDLINHLEEK